MFITSLPILVIHTNYLRCNKKTRSELNFSKLLNVRIDRKESGWSGLNHVEYYLGMFLVHLKWRSWNIHWKKVWRFWKFSSIHCIATDNLFLVPLLFIVPDVTLKLWFHWIRMPHNFPGKRRDRNTDWRTCVSHRPLLSQI